MSLSLATHYCGGKPILQEISIGENILSCGKVENERSLCQTPPFMGAIKQSPCCEDHQVFWDVEDRYNPEHGSSIQMLASQIFQENFLNVEVTSAYLYPITHIPNPPGISLLILNQVLRI